MSSSLWCCIVQRNDAAERRHVGRQTEEKGRSLNIANGRITCRFQARNLHSSWDRQREERPCDFVCSSMDNRFVLILVLHISHSEGSSRSHNSSEQQ